MMVELTTETCRREIAIKGRIVFWCCVCVDWIGIDLLVQQDDIIEMYLLYIMYKFY